MLDRITKLFFFVVLFASSNLTLAQTYTTIQDGPWSNPSTWDSNGVAPLPINAATVNVNHNVTFASSPLDIVNNGIFNINATLTVFSSDINLQVTSSRVNINSGGAIDILSGVFNINGGALTLNYGVLIVDNGNVNNNAGIVNFNYGRITTCSATVVDNTNGGVNGMFGIGTIHSSNGFIQDANTGNFSTDIAWCTDFPGNGVNLPTPRNCAVAAPSDGNCQSREVDYHICLLANTGDDDSDGIDNLCDLDDDNDGILDSDECEAVDSGLTGPLSGYTLDISSTNPSSHSVPHTLNSITYNGNIYDNFITPTSFQGAFSVSDPGRVQYIENGTIQFGLDSNSNFDNDVLTGFQSNDLGKHLVLRSGQDYTLSSYDVMYSSPINTTAGGFLAILDRAGNNSTIVQALDIFGNTIGTAVSVPAFGYQDTGHLIWSPSNQNAHIAVYPVDDLAAIGTQIYGLRVSFGSGATNDGPDNKVFFFGDFDAMRCDTDSDGLSNYLDLDSDNDGIYDAIEAGHNAALSGGRIVGAVGSDGIPNAVQAAGQQDSGSTNYALAESSDDTDTIYNFLDLDSDGDGIPDNVEAQTSLGYFAPQADDAATYASNNGLNSAYFGGLTPTNTDLTDSPDYLDTDSDNEGGNDTVEAGLVLSGLDADNDGLDNAIDTSSDYSDPGGTIDNPLATPMFLPDLDDDAIVGGGDVDFRDAIDNRSDIDDDGVPNIVDLDDDNDGITDAIEGCRDTDIAGTIGIGNNVVNATYNLEGTDLTYTLNNPNNANIYGFDAGLQGMAIRIEGAAGNTGSLTSEYNDPIALVSFKLTDFDNDTRATIEVYDENNVLYDLTSEGIESVGSAITQTGNLFVADATDIDGDDPADDPITSILFYFERTVSRVVINFDFPSNSTTRFTQPVYCSLDSDLDGVINIYDLDSDNDGIPDNVEAQTTLGYIPPNGVEGTNGIDTAYATGIIPTNTDGVDYPDFLDTDSDNEGANDTLEADIILTGNDSDNDGLDDATDATSDYSDVGGTIDDPLTAPVILPDDNSNVNSGGDVDFRDDTTSQDTDGDGIPNIVDLDDDNDGIPDSLEDLNLDGDNDHTTNFTHSDVIGGFPDFLDLDSDNDGIYDAVEAGHGMPFVDGRLIGSVGTDGIPDVVQDSPNSGTINYIPADSDGDGIIDTMESDSDNDGCFDTLEAGYSDGNNDGFLGVPPEENGVNGLLANEPDGYTTPLDRDANSIPDYREAGTSAVINDQPEDTAVCIGGDGMFSVTTTSGDTYQWQTFDGANWIDITDSGIYSGATTDTLILSGVTMGDNNSRYRVVVSDLAFVCGVDAISEESTLSVVSLPDVVVGDDMIVEGNDIIFPVTLSNPYCSTIDLLLTFDFTDIGTSVSDYDHTPVQVRFVAGQTTAAVVVNTNPDVIPEMDETFTVNIVSVDAGVVGNTLDTALGTILDDDRVDTDGDGIADVIDLDDENDGILDIFECGEPPTYTNQDFELGVNPASAVYQDGTPAFYFFDENDVTAWETTAAGNLIEIWESGHNGVPSYSGNYHAELNADEESALYQTYTSTPGEFTSISFAHRGRAGVDVVEIFQGPPGGPYASLGRFATDNTDWRVYNTWFVVPAGQTVSEIRFEAIATATGNNRVGNLLDDIYIYEGCHDFDNDGVSNNYDYDSDNDGIYDAVEAGHGQPQTDGVVDGPTGTNGVPDAVETSPDSDLINYVLAESTEDADSLFDYVDLDSDGDGCFDVTEAGYTDNDNNGYLGAALEMVDLNGVITSGVDGFTLPLDADSNGVFEYLEIGTTAVITNQPVGLSVCAGADAVFNVTASNSGVYQWQSFDGTNWNDLSNTGVYSGVDTDELTVASTIAENGTRYRVLASNITYRCADISDEVVLTVESSPILTIDDASIVEGGIMIVPITLSGSTCLGQDVTVTFNFTNGTASDTDYTNTPIQLIIPSGQTTANLMVFTTNDTILEGDEDFMISVASIDAGLVSDSSDTAVGTIIDNDNIIGTDNDNDGIADVDDLDDDNDGIPDTLEGIECIDDDYMAWEFNVPTGTYDLDFVQNPAITDWLVTGTSSIVIGSGLTAATPGSELEISGLDALTQQEAIVNNDYIESSFTTNTRLIDPKLTSVGVNWYRNGINTAQIGNSYYAALYISDDNFVTSTMLSADVHVHYPTDLVSEFFDLTSPAYEHNLLENTLYTLRVYVYDQQSDGNVSHSVFDDFTARFTACEEGDADNDGVPNHLDLDSDNDGILDAVEAGHNQSHTSGAVNGAVGVDGIPDSVQTDPDGGTINYTVAESTNDTDTINDFLDLDSDGDGIPDNVEAQITIGYVAPNPDDTATYLTNNGVNSAYLVGLTPTNTDTQDNPDYLDTDSDNEGGTDTIEAQITLLNLDSDNDGLDDATDATSDYSDVGGTIDNPLSGVIILLDTDKDATSGGDVDFRDAEDDRLDTDNDGIADAIDFDDDNDGILDSEELNVIIGNTQPDCTGETILDFSTAPTLESGTALLQGAVYRFPNVTTGTDALITIVETFNASVADIDNNTAEVQAFRPRTAFDISNVGKEGYIEYRMQFVTSGGTTPVTVPKFFININDTDGNVDYSEEIYVENPTHYIISNPSDLSVSYEFPWVVATGGTTEYAGAGNTNPQANFGINYENRSEIRFRAGITTIVPAVAASGREHNLDFRCTTNYVNPEIYILDSDEDGYPNPIDLDSDNDGIMDVVESGHGQGHTQGRILGPVGDDGVPDVVQTDPNGGTVNYNIGESTDDLDVLPNYVDLDADGDGIPDNVEAQTTVGYIAPSGSVDVNGVDTSYTSGLMPTNTDTTDLPDYLDTDSDNEGGDDTTEANITLSGIDADVDGLDDATDATVDYSDVGGTIDDPLAGPVILPDADSDATTGGDVDFRDATDDTVVDLDADDDGILDSFEDLNEDGDNDPSTNPTNSDSDAYPDYLDIDSDDDGIPDNVEAQTTSGYIPPSLIDANNNGVDDAYETGGNIGIVPVNTDGLDFPDYLDTDSDNDNVPDNIEGNDHNHDGIPDVVFIGSDKDDDGLDDNFEGMEQIDIDVNDEIDDPLNDLPNTDGDNEPDYRDIDDDDDEINTIDEDIDGDGDYANDDTDFDGTPDYLDPDPPLVIEDVEVFNVVTPNGDGAHDFLIITGLDIRPNNTLEIYNRWGILIYSTSSYNTNGNTFDGRSQGRATYNSNERLPVGTYFYILNYEDLDGTNKSLSGHLYLN